MDSEDLQRCLEIHYQSSSEEESDRESTLSNSYLYEKYKPPPVLVDSAVHKIVEIRQQVVANYKDVINGTKLTKSQNKRKKRKNKKKETILTKIEKERNEIGDDNQYVENNLFNNHREKNTKEETPLEEVMLNNSFLDNGEMENSCNDNVLPQNYDKIKLKKNQKDTKETIPTEIQKVIRPEQNVENSSIQKKSGNEKLLENTFHDETKTECVQEDKVFSKQEQFSTCSLIQNTSVAVGNIATPNFGIESSDNKTATEEHMPEIDELIGGSDAIPLKEKQVSALEQDAQLHNEAKRKPKRKRNKQKKPAHMDTIEKSPTLLKEKDMWLLGEIDRLFKLLDCSFALGPLNSITVNSAIEKYLQGLAKLNIRQSKCTLCICTIFKKISIVYAIFKKRNTPIIQPDFCIPDFLDDIDNVIVNTVTDLNFEEELKTEANFLEHQIYYGLCGILFKYVERILINILMGLGIFLDNPVFPNCEYPEMFPVITENGIRKITRFHFIDLANVIKRKRLLLEAFGDDQNDEAKISQKECDKATQVTEELASELPKGILTYLEYPLKWALENPKAVFLAVLLLLFFKNAVAYCAVVILSFCDLLCAIFVLLYFLIYVILSFN